MGLRSFRIGDFESVNVLWRSFDGVGLSASDSREGVRRFLDRNPGLSFVWEAHGRILGAIMCGEDGRRGYIHHLVVDASARRKRIGEKLVQASLEALTVRGILKCHIFVFGENLGALEFWRAIGWHDRDEIAMLSKDLIPARAESG
ncbi:MAG: GNAT family N-acetyltransferase [Gammaproteobacteria bacterium]|jgi:ribosomal protein S18 acetylase RimI-like enzyme